MSSIFSIHQLFPSPNQHLYPSFCSWIMPPTFFFTIFFCSITILSRQICSNAMLGVNFHFLSFSPFVFTFNFYFPFQFCFAFKLRHFTFALILKLFLPSSEQSRRKQCWEFRSMADPSFFRTKQTMVGKSCWSWRWWWNVDTLPIALKYIIR